MVFVTSDLMSPLEKSMAEMLGVFKDDMPMIRLFDTRTTLTKYKMDNDITKENIQQFIKDWENGTLTPYLKSEKTPKNQTTSYMILVASNFEQIVNDENKDVLVLFCNQINDKCKELNILYEAFAKKAHSKSNDTLLVTYMDNKLNELEKYKVYKVPHLKLFSVGNKNKPLEFSGEDYSYDNIVDFVAQNSKRKNVFMDEL